MMIFVMAIVVTGAVKWSKTKAQVEETEVAVNRVTQQFAEGEVDAWARGELVDPWDNGYILDRNRHPRASCAA